MDPILHTPRLKLTLITHAERGSEELNWLHELRSNKQATAWRYTNTLHPSTITISSCVYASNPQRTQTQPQSARC